MADTAVDTSLGPEAASALALAPAATSKYKITMKSLDMPDERKRAVIAMAEAALDKLEMEKDVAESLKRQCDAAFGNTWHCVVGKKWVMERRGPGVRERAARADEASRCSFGSYVTHGGCQEVAWGGCIACAVSGLPLCQACAPHPASNTRDHRELTQSSPAAETKNFIYFTIDKLSIMLWKTS